MLVVGFRLGRTVYLEFKAEHHVMRVVVGRTETVVLVKMLECAEEPRIVDAGGIIRFGFEKARESPPRFLSSADLGTVIRNNEPARNWYFVPGGMILKNERLADACNDLGGNGFGDMPLHSRYAAVRPVRRGAPGVSRPSSSCGRSHGAAARLLPSAIRRNIGSYRREAAAARQCREWSA